MNINDRVRVKLTPEGENVYLVSLSDLKLHPDIERSILNRYYTSKNSEGYFTTILWDLMNIFGPEMWMGNPKNMFEDNKIEIFKNGEWI